MAKTVAKLKGGELSLAGTVNERMPNLRKRTKIRYIRGTSKGSTANAVNHLVEIQAFNYADVNVALGKPVINSYGVDVGTVPTDGSTLTNPYVGVGEGYTLDLGTPQYIDYIKVWHYWGDGRTYKDVKLEVSEDGETYYTIFDSIVDGEYAETESGKLHIVPPIGIAEHYPLDGSLLGYRSLYHSKIAYFTREDANTDWYLWFSKRCKNLVKITNSQFQSMTIEDAKQYDLIYCDYRVHTVPDNYTAKLKTFVDAGVSCIARGNDAFVNVFTETTTWVEKAEREVEVLDTAPFEVTTGFRGTADPVTFTTKLRNGAVPLTIRKGTNLITGYMYTSHTGAVYIFDGEGHTETPIPDYFLSSFEYALGRSTAKITNGNPSAITPEGLLVGTGITNLVTSHNIYNNHHADVTITPLNETYRGHQVYRWAYTARTDTQLQSINKSLNQQGVFSNTITFKANTKYSSSIIWRNVNKEDSEMGGTASNIAGWTNGLIEDMGDGWKRYNGYRDGTVTANGIDARHMSVKCPSLKLNETLYVDFCCFQIHEGDIYPKHYTKTSSVRSSIRIPFNLKPPFTISLKHRSSTLLSTVVDSSTSPKVLQLSYYNTNASLTLWNYHSLGLRIYLKSDTGSEWSASKSFKNFTADEWNNKDCEYAIVAHNSKRFELFMNGVSLGVITTEVAATLFENIIIDPDYNSCAIVKDVTIFDKALNAEEVRKLHSSSMNFESNGSLSVKGLDEQLPHIPEDALYFPLANNATDVKGLVSARAYSRIHQDGTAWVGVTQDNKYTNPNFDTLSGWSFWGNTGYKATHTINTVKEFVYGDKDSSLKVECAADSPYPYLVYQSPAFSGGHRSMQAIICMGDGSPVTKDKVYPSWNGGNGGLSPGNWSEITRIGTSKWYLCKAEAFSQDGTNNLVGIYVKPGFTAYIDHMALEHLPYCSPVNSVSTNEDTIRFNLTEDYQMKWDEDWTIMYWKKPKGTSTITDLKGYNIDSLGVHNSTTNPGYVWWGKNINADTLNHPSGRVIGNNYFKEWAFLALVSVKGVITLYIGDAGGWVSTYLVTAKTPSFFLSHHGYDLTLGGHNTHIYNAGYYKDLVVVKRAFTEDQLKDVYKNEMSTLKNKLMLRGEVRELV